MKLKFVVNFPYKGGGGIWNRFAESAKKFLTPDDFILINALPLISRKGNGTSILKKTIKAELKEKFHDFPNVGIITDFGKTFIDRFEKTEFSKSNSDFNSFIEKSALIYQQLANIWKPDLYTSIDIPTVKPPHIKIKGGERKALFANFREGIERNYQILEIYKSLLDESSLNPNNLLVSLQGYPKLPDTYLMAFRKFGSRRKVAGFSIGSLTETKISISYNQKTLHEQIHEFYAICSSVRKGIEEMGLMEDDLHLHFMGAGSFVKLPILAYVFCEIPRIRITADLQTPVKRAAGDEYLKLSECKYETIENQVLDTCTCEICSLLNTYSFKGSIDSFLHSQEGREIICEKSGETVRRKTIFIWHNILVQRKLAKDYSSTDNPDEVLSLTGKYLAPKLYLAIKNVVQGKTLV